MSQQENTHKYDDIITGLELYKSKFEERGIPDTWTEEVNKVLRHTDALRRVEAFNLLNDALDDLLNKIGGQEKVKYVAGYYSTDVLWHGEHEYVLTPGRYVGIEEQEDRYTRETTIATACNNFDVFMLNRFLLFMLICILLCFIKYSNIYI